METSTSEGGTNGASTSSPFRVGAAGSSPLWRVDTAPALSPITEMPSTEPPKVRRSWSSSSGSRGRGSGMLRAGSSRWKSRTKKKDPNAPSGSLPEEVAPLVSRRPVQFFKEKHILVEMNELRGMSSVRSSSFCNAHDAHRSPPGPRPRPRPPTHPNHITRTDGPREFARVGWVRACLVFHLLGEGLGRRGVSTSGMW